MLIKTCVKRNVMLKMWKIGVTCNSMFRNLHVTRVLSCFLKARLRNYIRSQGGGHGGGGALRNHRELRLPKVSLGHKGERNLVFKNGEKTHVTPNFVFGSVERKSV